MGNGSFLSPSISSLLLLSLSVSFFFSFSFLYYLVSLTILNLVFTLLSTYLHLLFFSLFHCIHIFCHFHSFHSHICFLFFRSCNLFSFSHSYQRLSFSHLSIHIYISFSFSLFIFIFFSLLPFLLTRTSSPFMLRPFLTLLSLSLFYSHLFTSLSCSYTCIYLSPLFLASVIRTYARLSLLLNVTARG